jgi:hypothetical protein
MKEEKNNENRIPFEVLIMPLFVGAILYFALSNLNNTSKMSPMKLRTIKSF